jgi:hypothetical protein
MFTSQGEKWQDDLHIISLVELDMHKMRVHIVLSRETIRKRLRGLEHSSGTTTENFSSSNRRVTTEQL